MNGFFPLIKQLFLRYTVIKQKKKSRIGGLWEESA